MTSLNIGVFGARGIPSTYSGYETFLTTLLPELVERGHHVTMYCRRGETSGDDTFRGVRRVVLPAIPGKQFSTLSHGAVASVRSRIARHDVVLTVNVANALFCALHRYTGRPIVLNTDGQEWLRGKWGGAAKSYFKTSAHLAGRTATALISDCAAIQDLYRDDFHAMSTVIPYCIPAEALRPAPGVLQRLKVEPGEYFVVAARLNPENNVDSITAAYSTTDLEAPLLVLGAANYASPVEQNLADIAARDPRVRIIGHVDSRDEFFQLLGSARAYLHGHSVGGINPSLVEAMHAGAHIAALDTPFNRETLDTTGQFFTLQTLPSMLEALQCATDEIVDGRRNAARQRAADLFNVTDVVDAYEALLIEVTQHSARRSFSMATRWSQRRDT